MEGLVMGRQQINRQERGFLDAMMFSAQEWEGIATALSLSQRQLQIIIGIFNDQTESAIAIHLGVSPHTIHTHLNRLYAKLSVHTRAGLILRIMAEGLPEMKLRQRHISLSQEVVPANSCFRMGL
jgi:DNA-binding CsgD family transcriptional regulator